MGLVEVGIGSVVSGHWGRLSSRFVLGSASLGLLFVIEALVSVDKPNRLPGDALALNLEFVQW